jgi:hypothetical protein
MAEVARGHALLHSCSGLATNIYFQPNKRTRGIESCRAAARRSRPSPPRSPHLATTGSPRFVRGWRGVSHHADSHLRAAPRLAAEEPLSWNCHFGPSPQPPFLLSSRNPMEDAR